MTYEIKEYNQEPATDKNPYPDTYTDKTFSLFYQKEKAIKYAKENDIYGKIFEYDDTEYGEYLSGDDYDGEIPEPMDEWDT